MEDTLKRRKGLLEKHNGADGKTLITVDGKKAFILLPDIKTLKPCHQSWRKRMIHVTNKANAQNFKEILGDAKGSEYAKYVVLAGKTFEEWEEQYQLDAAISRSLAEKDSLKRAGGGGDAPDGKRAKVGEQEDVATGDVVEKLGKGKGFMDELDVAALKHLPRMLSTIRTDDGDDLKVEAIMSLAVSFQGGGGGGEGDLRFVPATIDLSKSHFRAGLSENSQIQQFYSILCVGDDKFLPSTCVRFSYDKGFKRVDTKGWAPIDDGKFLFRIPSGFGVLKIVRTESMRLDPGLGQVAEQIIISVDGKETKILVDANGEIWQISQTKAPNKLDLAIYEDDSTVEYIEKIGETFDSWKDSSKTYLNLVDANSARLQELEEGDFGSWMQDEPPPSRTAIKNFFFRATAKTLENWCALLPNLLSQVKALEESSEAIKAEDKRVLEAYSQDESSQDALGGMRD